MSAATALAAPFAPDRPVALVGLMGVGKTSVGRRLAAHWRTPFVDADAEIEAAAGRSVSDIFAELGEPAFREGERRVIARLLDGGLRRMGRLGIRCRAISNGIGSRGRLHRCACAF